MQSVEVSLRGRIYRIFGYEDEGWFKGFSKGGSFDQFNFARFEEMLEPDSVCLDIGANMGLFTLSLASLVPDGKVYAFEASPKLNVALRKTIKVSGATNIELCPWIVGKEGLYGEFIEDNEWLSSSHFIPSDDAELRCRSIDSLELPKVDLIKIDVEGAELDVIEGALRTIERCNPLVIMEFNSFAFIHYRELVPRRVLNEIFKHFANVAFYRDSGSLNPVLMTDREAFLKDNMFGGFVNDLVCFNWDIQNDSAIRSAA